MKSNEIFLEDVLKLRKTFKEKSWDRKPNEESVFENFCHLLRNLNNDQRGLIHELSEEYLWMGPEDYAVNFNSLLNKLDKAVLSKCLTIYLFPIVSPENENELKSGKHCIYLFKGLFALNPNYREIKTEIIQTFDELKKKNFRQDGSELIFLIDDFIGSGKTFEATWSEARKNSSINEAFVKVLALVIQEKAFDDIFANFGLSPLYFAQRKKGISDRYQGETKQEKIRLMNEIEEIIKPHPYHFGYDRSEALVTMIRTPDNTFPVFWMKYKIKEKEYFPPFLRD